MSKNDEAFWINDWKAWFRPYITYFKPDRPSLFSRTLAQQMPSLPGQKRLLDIGCGSGIIGIHCLLKKKARSVTFNDLFPEWINTTWRNVDLKIQTGEINPDQVRFLKPASFAMGISAEEVRRHDMLVFNPPQLPSALVETTELRIIEADAIQRAFRISGSDGLKFAREFFQWYADIAPPKPDAVIILSGFLGRERIEEEIRSRHLKIIGGWPKGVRVELRGLLTRAAAHFAQSPEQAKDRSLKQINGKWTKQLLVYRINNA